MQTRNICGWMVSLLALTGLVILAGCGSGSQTPTGPTGPQYTLQQSVEIAGQPGAVGGNIFTMSARANDPTVLIDQAVNAPVTLTGTTTTGTSYSTTTNSTTRGGYNFSNVPAGTYTVTATATSPLNPGVTLNGTVNGVVVRGNIPTLMVNLMLGAATNMSTFTGHITQDGKAAAGAVVSIDVTAHTPAYPQDTSAYSSVILSTTSTDGSYQIVVPGGGTDYYIASHSDTSMVAQTEDITQPSTTTPNANDLTLTDATSPIFAKLTLDIVSATLPAATAQAVTQTLTSRMAIARTLHAPQASLDRLQQLYTRTRGTRLVNGFIENDLYWSLAPVEPGQTYVDQGVRGFNIYRAGKSTDPFVLTGTNRDPYLEYFYDNDPALRDLLTRYYTVTSYAANGKESNPATAILARPLPQITGQGPADGSTLSAATGAFTWATVPGALSYVVVKYTNPPSFNDTPVSSLIIHQSTETSESLAGLPPGTYWWSLAAFNTTDPNMATAASYSAYQKVVVTP